MFINETMLFKNLITSIFLSLLMLLILLLITWEINKRASEIRESKYRLAHNIKQKKKKKHSVSLRRLILEGILVISILAFMIFKDIQYLMDYNIKDYLTYTGIIQNIVYYSGKNGDDWWDVKIQGREKPFSVSTRQRELLKEGEIHTITYAKRSGTTINVR